jgi:hypothetical protein
MEADSTLEEVYNTSKEMKDQPQAQMESHSLYTTNFGTMQGN